ncbi:hypothetical protein MRB53_020133 [Persea americana]|uniref:Uncharacterized protein n=1 Tax=Persea americana TaxID=3435 RepID=A0ACC2L0Z5_PERAE|nr:hypothetical protein MRB53_020133 [Persea americana]
MEKRAAACGSRKRVICDRHKRSQTPLTYPPPPKPTFTFPIFPSRALSSHALPCPATLANLRRSQPKPETTPVPSLSLSISLSLFPPVFLSPSTPPIEDSFSLTAAAARSLSPHSQSKY